MGTTKRIAFLTALPIELGGCPLALNPNVCESQGRIEFRDAALLGLNASGQPRKGGGEVGEEGDPVGHRP